MTEQSRQKDDVDDTPEAATEDNLQSDESVAEGSESELKKRLRRPGEQGELPLALVKGEPVQQLPQDLYIPPEALEIFLDAFEGPLDLLLYLIKRNNMDILDIPVAEITKQYIAYIELMQEMRFELAAEYLVMAATLAEIKSRMLLPRVVEEEGEEEDPRAELIRRLQEYERFKTAAERLDELPRLGRDSHLAQAGTPEMQVEKPQPSVALQEILESLREVMHRADMYESHQIEQEALSTRERMGEVLDQLRGRGFVPFVKLFRVEEGRLGVVVTFLAIMELIKESLVELIQTEAYGPIHVKARTE